MDLPLFVKESYQELRKATWLTREQVTGSTIVVLILVGIMAVYAGAIDWFLALIVGSLLGGP